MLLAACLFAAIVVLPNAHSHNDYEQPRPLLDALEAGFGSVEADVFLEGGRLLVAHERRDLRPDRSLIRLYLEPLAERVSRYGGRVYPEGPPLILLMDIKSDAESTYARLRAELTPYRHFLTEFREGQIHERAVTVIVSGARATATIAGENPRWVAVDGRLSDLGANPPVDLMPLISDHWGRIFRWRGDDRPTEEEVARLRAVVKEVHGQGRRFRLWGTPDVEPVWRLLRDERVDLINTDRIQDLARFLRGDGWADWRTHQVRNRPNWGYGEHHHR